MKTSDLIKVLQDSLAKNGDLEVFSQDHYAYNAACVSVGDAEDYAFPDDWNMPDTFLELRDGR